MLRLGFFTIFVACLFAAGSARAADYDLRSEFGPVHLHIAGDGDVSGFYPDYQGRIFGHLTDDRRIEGIWVQPPSGDHRCREERHGSYHWGRLVFWRPEGHEVDGRWGYCDERPDRPWNAHIVHAGHEEYYDRGGGGR